MQYNSKLAPKPTSLVIGNYMYPKMPFSFRKLRLFEFFILVHLKESLITKKRFLCFAGLKSGKGGNRSLN